jgi:nucleoside-diphosphate kinase
MKRTSIAPEVLLRWSRRGFLLVGIKMIVPTEEKAAAHYAHLARKPFFDDLVEFLTSGPILLFVFQGKDVIRQSRRMLGTTNPLDSPPGTIRGDFSLSTAKNAVHGSDSPAAAKAEIELWFDPDEIIDATLLEDSLTMLYDDEDFDEVKP